MPDIPSHRGLLTTSPSSLPRHNLPRIDTSPTSTYQPTRSSTRLSPPRKAERRVASDDSGRTVRMVDNEVTPVGPRLISSPDRGEGEVGWMMDQLAEISMDGRARSTMVGFPLQGDSTSAAEEEVVDSVDSKDWDAFLDEFNIGPSQRETMNHLSIEKKLQLLRQSSRSTFSAGPPQTEVTDSTSLLPIQSSSDSPGSGILAWTKKFSLSTPFPWSLSSSSQPPPTSMAIQTSALAALRQLSTTAVTAPSTSVLNDETQPMAPQDTGGSLWLWWNFGGTSEEDEEKEVMEEGKEREEKLLIKALGVIKSCNDRTILHNNLIDIRIILTTGPLSIIRAFFQHDGSEMIIRNFNLFLSDRKGKEGHSDSSCLLELLRIIRTLLNTEVGFPQITNTPEITFFIVSCTYLSDSSTKVACLAAELSAATCTLQQDSHPILDAFLDARPIYRETFRFEKFVKSLGKKVVDEEETGADVWEWRLSAMMLINALVGFLEDAESRTSLRGELKRRGLEEQIILWKYTNMPESALIQVSTYEEEQLIDIDYLGRAETISRIVSPPPTARLMNLNRVLKGKSKRKMVDSTRVSFRPVADLDHKDILKRWDLQETLEDGDSRKDLEEPEAQEEASDGSDSGVDAEKPMADVELCSSSKRDQLERQADNGDEYGDYPPPPPPPPLPSQSLGFTLILSPSPSYPSPSVLDDETVAPPPPPPPPPPHGYMHTPPPKRSDPQEGKSTTRAPRLRPLFWQPVKVAPPDSVWTKVAQWQIPAMDPEEIVRLFEVKSSQKPTGKEPHKTGGHTAPGILAMARANNIAIMLSRIPMTFAQIRTALLEVDVEDLTTDTLLNIQRNLPTSEETEKLNAYSGEVEKLEKPERFLLELLKVPRLSSRLKCIVYQREFPEQLAGVLPDLKLLHTACNELRWNEPLEQLLASILAVGNTLNAGTIRGNAVGFSLLDLLKLREVRTQVGSELPSLLHYLVRLWLASRQPTVMNCLELKSLQAAARISPTDVFSACRELLTGFQDVVNEVHLISASTAFPSEGDHFLDVFKPFIAVAEGKMTKMERMMVTLDSEIRQTLQFFGTPETDYETFSTLLQALAGFHVLLQNTAEAIAKESMSDIPDRGMTGRSYQGIRDGQLDATLRTMRTKNGTCKDIAKESRRTNRIMWDGGSTHTRV